MQPATEADLLDRLIDAHERRRRIVFLVGAGLALPPAAGAPGVPGAGELVRRVLSRLGEPGPLAYQQALELYRIRRGQHRLDELVREAVLEACVHGDPADIAAARKGDLEACRRLERNPAAWALPPGVEALGQLLTACPDTFGQAVLTTNFDPLVEVAVRRAGGRSHTSYLSEDGRIDIRHSEEDCHVVHVHGFWSKEEHTAHTEAQLTQPRPRLQQAVKRFLERSDLVVLGYGGWRDVFAEMISSILTDPAQGTEILWCFHEKSGEEIEARYTANLERLAPGLATVAVPYAGIDANVFLVRLAQAVTASRPAPVRHEMTGSSHRPSPFVAGPPILTDAGLFGRRLHQEQIAQALERWQMVQLLGERRMGKTSLLRWAERHAGELRPGSRVVWVDAGALADRSPAALIRAIGESLGRAGEPLESLLPLVLLVDEASALAAPGHSFDAAFLGRLRAAGQGQRLAWISTSRADLQTLFKEDHLNSSFLNDSLRLQVGALEEEGAEALLSSGLTPELAALAIEEAGRLPYPLQWIADALFRGQPPGPAADALREALEPTFDSWWRWRDGEEQRLLGACVDGVVLAGLAPRDRRRLRGLVNRGLVVEGEGRFTLPGAAWRGFVAERQNA